MSWTRALSSPRRRSAAAVGAAIIAIVGLLVVRNAVVDGPLQSLRRSNENVYEGSWHFPRGGPFILGFETFGGSATLEVDGKRVVVGAGQRTSRVVFEPGVYSVRFQAAEGARLLWHPPGRRGPLEYVPPSSLSPEPPDTASFGSWVGASPVDGAIATLILIVLIALIAFLAREAIARAARENRRALAAVAVVFAVALLIRLFDLGGAGQTWDEDVNWSAGRNYITNLLSLDFRQASWVWNYEHPPVMKYIAGIGAQWADGFGPARALSAVMLALACGLLVPIGTRLYNLRVGVLAGGIAALTPHLIAHGKVVGHEAPSVLLWTLAVWLSLRAHDDSETGDRWQLPRRMIVIGVVVGLAISSRFANVLVAPLVGALLLLEAPRGHRLRTVYLGLSIISLVAIAVAFAVWPRLWVEPLTHLQEAWKRLSGLHGFEPFLGGKPTNSPPAHYFAVYLYATAPLGLVLGALVWVIRSGWRRQRRALCVAAWLLAPLIITLSPVRQDGVRYILPALAAMSLAAAVGFETIADLIRDRVRAVPWAYTALAAVVVVYLGVSAARIHPYYLDYYGEQVGGPSHVARARLFEIGWWGEGVDRVMDYVNREAAPGARIDKRRLVPSHVTWLRADLWKPQITSGAFPSPTADYVLVNELSVRAFSPPSQLELVYEVSAQGAPLARVYRRVAPPASPPR